MDFIASIFKGYFLKMITKDTRKAFQGEMADGTHILYPFFLDDNRGIL